MNDYRFNFRIFEKAKFLICRIVCVWFFFGFICACSFFGNTKSLDLIFAQLDLADFLTETV